MLQICDLPWLPKPPVDFADICRALDQSPGPTGATIQNLATHALSAIQSVTLARAIARCQAAGRDLEPLKNFRLGVLANATIDGIADCLPAAAARHGVALELIVPPYDQVAQQALDAGSMINSARLDATLLAVDHRWLQLNALASADEAEHRIEAAVDRLFGIADALRHSNGAAVIMQTLATPPEPLFGSYDVRVAGSLRSSIANINRRIVTKTGEAGFYLFDTAALAERIGTNAWFDPVQWVSYKSPISAHCTRIYADHLGRLLGAIRGKARKCLVLDLDNTCWGGVIGDDGLEGIEIGQGSPAGEAFLGIQRLAKDLRSRGIILAVASKNDEDVARSPFRQHPDMLLKEQDFAVFQANWIDKASNLEAVAEKLNIGLDALVMLDDNPAERAQLRAALPMVAVPELPSDPSWFGPYLMAAGYFEATSFSKDDLIRIESYATDSQRAEVRTKARNLREYLAALEMVMTIRPFDAIGRQRITQLINKTNQFNLTTRRYTEAEVAAIQDDPDTYTLQLRLRDKFGDLGMVAVAICRTHDVDEQLVWCIDTWLMSCRVLGRRVEEAMLNEIATAARHAGIKKIVASYRPTSKNRMVYDHYEKLGFRLIGEDEIGVCHYDLRPTDVPLGDFPFRIDREPGQPNMKTSAAVT